MSMVASKLIYQFTYISCTPEQPLPLVLFTHGDELPAVSLQRVVLSTTHFVGVVVGNLGFRL